MNTLDFVFAAIVLVAALRCFFRGIIEEVMSAAAMVGGLLAGVLLYRPVSAWVGGLLGLDGFWAALLGFAIGFIAVFVAVKLLESSLRTILDKLELESLDRGLGLLFGALEGVVVVAIILIALRYQPLFDVKELLDGSAVAGILMPIIVERLPGPGAG
ncbi:MAG: CvpA family protein [Spirochaetia bacterium]|nr:CvpA family protein [Spirochaetia bacterium]